MIPGEALQALLNTPPSKASGPAEHRLEWRVQKGRDQAAPVLSHAVRRETDKALIFIDRRFYSGYDYDALLALLGVLPTSQGDRSVVFYINRTYTAQVARFGGGAKRSIGRKLMKKELVAEMERLQKVAARLRDAPNSRVASDAPDRALSLFVLSNRYSSANPTFNR